MKMQTVPNLKHPLLLGKNFASKKYMVAQDENPKIAMTSEAIGGNQTLNLLSYKTCLKRLMSSTNSTMHIIENINITNRILNKHNRRCAGSNSCSENMRPILVFLVRVYVILYFILIRYNAKANSQNYHLRNLTT